MLLAKKNHQFFFTVALCLLGYGCVEPFDAKTEIFESALVIDATITNEDKQQEILLSRSFRFEEDGPSPELNANVKIVEDNGTEYFFEEAEPGKYLSTNAFGTQPNKSYQLLITTNNGRSYSSKTTQLTQITQIDNLYASRMINDDGEEGMALYVDSFDPSGNSNYYRYEYEETYKIIAPKWGPQDLIGDPDEDKPCGVLIVPREQDEQVCYTTDSSNRIILTDTNIFAEDRVSQFPVRFINRNNYIISHRYSILVRQFVQSNEAYAFFETLRDFSGSESLFSETQPGFLAGNISSLDNESEKVLGYFDVASVTEQRIFFNYSDFFPNEELPPYINPCRESAPVLINQGGECVLSKIVDNNQVRYVDVNSRPEVGPGPFIVVTRVCGDCTVLGGLEIPDFWIE